MSDHLIPLRCPICHGDKMAIMTVKMYAKVFYDEEQEAIVEDAVRGRSDQMEWYACPACLVLLYERELVLESIKSSPQTLRQLEEDDDPDV